MDGRCIKWRAVKMKCVIVGDMRNMGESWTGRCRIVGPRRLGRDDLLGGDDLLPS